MNIEVEEGGYTFEERITHLHRSPRLERMSHCRVCGKPIAASVEALCCEHLYGKKIINDKEGGEEDTVEHLNGFVGQRISEGFTLLRDE